MGELTPQQRAAMERAAALARLRAEMSESPRLTAGQEQAAPGGVAADPQAVGELQSRIGAGVTGLQSGLTYGLVDEGVGALLGGALGGMPNEEGSRVVPFNYDVPMAERYGAVRDFVRSDQQAAAEAHPGATTLGQVVGGAGLAASLPAAIGKGLLSSMGRMAGLGAAEGAVTGAGYSDADTWGGVAEGAGWGGAIGGVGGALAVPAIALGRGVLDAGGGVLRGLTGTGSETRAARTIARTMDRANMTPQQIAADLANADFAGQHMYAIADALGSPGQRTLAGVARSPGEGAAEIRAFLNERQMGQGDRIGSFLRENLDVEDTARIRQEALRRQRADEAGMNYDAARDAATPVDVGPALGLIDQRLGQINMPGVGQAVNASPLDQTMQRIRDRLATPASQLPEGTNSINLSDFGRVFEIKRELDGAIGAATRSGDGFQVQQLTALRNALDDALSTASAPYATARDTYRTQSQAIDAIPLGTDTARAPQRVDDALGTYRGLDDQPQAGFRAGYLDQLLGRMENQNPGIDFSRQLGTPKHTAMITEMAGDPQRITEQLARERTMFETRNMALGGSPTANLLQDVDDVGSNAMRITEALTSPQTSLLREAGRVTGNVLTGADEQTRLMIARALLSRDPEAALAPLLRRAMISGQIDQASQGAVRQGGYELGVR